MADTVIRNFHSGDLGACRALYRELTDHHRDIFDNVYDDDEIAGDAPENLFDQHLARVGAERVWVAEHSGRILGFAALIVDGVEAEIEPVVVTSPQRHHGVGRSLVAAVVCAAAELGVKYLCAKPVARNVDAVAFFHEAGFRALGHIQLVMDLDAPTPGAWKPGPQLFDRSFDY